MPQPSVIPTVKLLIGGKLVESSTSHWRDVVNPATQEVLARVPFATEAEMNAAVASAKEASRPGARRRSARGHGSSSSTSN